MKLIAPLAGWSAPLDEAPDQVFATRMLGDGIAIDPTGGVLHAPCAGEVLSLPESRHAVTLRARGGAEILMHVGIDTVALRGEGFEALVSLGQHVEQGQPLLRFDLDVLARRAKSLLTPIIVTNGESFRITKRHQHAAVQVGDFLLELVETRAATETSTQPSRTASETTVTQRATLAFGHGLHARPAALVANCSKTFKSETTVAFRDRTANARSVISLMALGAHHGDEVTIAARGEDAEAAVAAVNAVLLRGDTDTASASSSPPAARAPAQLRAGTTNVARGITAFRGLAIGAATPLSRPEIAVAEAGAGAPFEAAALERARWAVGAHLRAVVETAPAPTRGVMQAHLALLEDPELAKAASEWIALGKSAGFAWRQAVRDHASVLESLGDPRMAERVDDLHDLESQVLLALDGARATSPVSLPEDAIVIANDLLPSQLVALDARRLAGICLAGGGATSHAAILAAAMGVPTIVAAGPGVLAIARGTTVVLDADSGTLHAAPDSQLLADARTRLAAQRARQTLQRAAAQRECRTADGARIEMFANVGSVAEAEAAIYNGAEGCGLLRTEFLFLDRTTPPDEAEQTREYQRIASAFGGRPVVIRTLDIGGDKPIPYLQLPREANPALGLRGVRTSLWRPDLLKDQLKAILAVEPSGVCRVLLPMVVSIAEVRAVRALLGRAPVALGVMIETPAAALLADQLAEEADFLSIGTNDLTQYTLAMDRGHPELAGQLDSLHPAVLRLIATTTRAAAARGRQVGVCGGLAGDPAAVPILIGLGVTELSVVPAAVAPLKALIGGLSLDACRKLAHAALEQRSAEEVRALAARTMPARGALVIEE